MASGTPDYTVRIVGDDGEADLTVAVIGDQVVDLTGASDGDVLTVQADGSVAPEAPTGDAPENMVTDDTDQTIDGVKSFVKVARFLAGLRLANGVAVRWRNAADTADLLVITLDVNNNLVFAGALAYVFQAVTAFTENITITGFKQVQWEGGNYWTLRVSGAQWQLYSAATGDVAIAGNESTASGQTGVSVLVNTGAGNTLRRVNVGAADSGGSGQRLLTVAN